MQLLIMHFSPTSCHFILLVTMALYANRVSNVIVATILFEVTVTKMRSAVTVATM
jgi:hypothetical protein